MAMITYFNVKSLIDISDWVDHTNEVILTAENALEQLINIETGERGFLVTGKDNYLEPLNLGKKNFSSLITKGKQLTSDNITQVQRWDKLQQMQKEWLENVVNPEIASRKEVARQALTMDGLINKVENGSGKTLMDAMIQVPSSGPRKLPTCNDSIMRFELTVLKRGEDSPNIRPYRAGELTPIPMPMTNDDAYRPSRLEDRAAMRKLTADMAKLTRMHHTLGTRSKRRLPSARMTIMQNIWMVK